MPFKFDLTWIAHAKRWRKRYRGRTYFLKTNIGGKKDRTGYLAALQEWERLKAFLDGLGPNPYSPTGILLPVATAEAEASRIQPSGVSQPAPVFEQSPDDLALDSLSGHRCVFAP